MLFAALSIGLAVTAVLARDTAATLSVCNDGCGLPEGFEPTASKGLGMTLVSSLAAQIGGKLQIDRGDDNECPRFTVLI